MNKTQFIEHLKTIYHRVGEPELAKPDPVDIQRRAALGQTWYQVAVSEIGTDANGKEIDVTAPVHFYVYDESTPEERAVFKEKAEFLLEKIKESKERTFSVPEIEEFIDIRKPTGDQNRRSPNLHHAVVIPDAFMEAVINETTWDLVSPKDGRVVKTVKAKYLWEKILEVRQTLKGEPYMLFVDTVNELAPIEYQFEEVEVETSNLCTEIMLRTDENHSGVCCLGSINLEYWEEYQFVFDGFIADCCDYLDNILQDFIDRTEGLPGFERARNGAIDERSIGLGVMGFHSLLQSKSIPWESPMAKGLNITIFEQIKKSADYHNRYSASCPMSDRMPVEITPKRNIHVTAIAPTMSISSFANVTSSGIEPWGMIAFTKKVKQGSFPVRNKYLAKIIDDYAVSNDLGGVTPKEWIEAQWSSIKKNNGSVQHLEWLDAWNKDVFKTAFEIDQKWVIEMAGDRSPLIDQGQSVNLFIPGGSHVQVISDLHILAWKKKLKSLYYLRSSAVNRAGTSSTERQKINTTEEVSLDKMMTDTCIGCG